MRNFWRTLGDGQHGLTAAEASAIERTLSVGAFVKNYVPLVQNLVQGFSSGTYQTLPDLARLEPAGLGAAGQPDRSRRRALTPRGPPRRPRYSPAWSTLASPAPTRPRRYPAASQPAAFVQPPQQQPLAQFFQNNPDLELVKDDIPAYLATPADGAFAGISPDDQAAVVANARSFQRVLRVAPDPDVAQTLLGLGIKSATQIATLGQQQFFVKATAAGLTRPEANQAFQAAAQRHASVVSLYMQQNRDAIGHLAEGDRPDRRSRPGPCSRRSAGPVAGHAVRLTGLLRH